MAGVTQGGNAGYAGYPPSTMSRYRTVGARSRTLLVYEGNFCVMSSKWLLDALFFVHIKQVCTTFDTVGSRIQVNNVRHTDRHRGAVQSRAIIFRYHLFSMSIAMDMENK